MHGVKGFYWIPPPPPPPHTHTSYLMQPLSRRVLGVRSYSVSRVRSVTPRPGCYPTSGVSPRVRSVTPRPECHPASGVSPRVRSVTPRPECYPTSGVSPRVSGLYFIAAPVPSSVHPAPLTRIWKHKLGTHSKFGRPRLLLCRHQEARSALYLNVWTGVMPLYLTPGQGY